MVKVIVPPVVLFNSEAMRTSTCDKSRELLEKSGVVTHHMQKESDNDNCDDQSCPRENVSIVSGVKLIYPVI